MVLGFEPVDKPIIPRRSFFDKGYFLALTGTLSTTDHQVYLGSLLDLCYGALSNPLAEQLLTAPIYCQRRNFWNP
jgi:hypothetical protein